MDHQIGEGAMALHDLIGMIDNGLKSVFDRKPTDHARLRKPLLKGIERAREQHAAGKTGPGQWWKARNGVVAFTAKLKGQTLDINGSATNHMAEAQFTPFLDALQAAVQAGEFDAELANHGRGDASVAVPTKRATLSPEAAKARGQKAAASRRANKKKRQSAGE
jgi:hypothetical protein